MPVKLISRCQTHQHALNHSCNQTSARLNGLVPGSLAHLSAMRMTLLLCALAALSAQLMHHTASSTEFHKDEAAAMLLSHQPSQLPLAVHLAQHPHICPCQPTKDHACARHASDKQHPCRHCRALGESRHTVHSMQAQGCAFPPHIHANQRCIVESSVGASSTPRRRKR